MQPSIRILSVLTLFAVAMPYASAQPVLDFTEPASGREFRVINDGVMGGVSTSRLEDADGNATPQYPAPFDAPRQRTRLRFMPTDFSPRVTPLLIPGEGVVWHVVP